MKTQGKSLTAVDVNNGNPMGVIQLHVTFHKIQKDITLQEKEKKKKPTQEMHRNFSMYGFWDSTIYII